MNADAPTIAMDPPTLTDTIDTPPASLPSQVEETLAACPRFRILVVGKSGVGKSALISTMFNISKKDLDVVEGRAGKANIDKGYTPPENSYFVLHDSKGFEPGTTGNWDIVKDFITRRSTMQDVKDRLHVIWMCIETPREGSRAMQTGDEELVKLAKEKGIPIIVVFTKLDFLFNESYLKVKEKYKSKKFGILPRTQPNDTSLEHEAAKKTKISLKSAIKDFEKQTNLRPFCPIAVSTKETYPNFLKTLEDLAKTTQKSLHTEETLLPWGVAQRIDPRQKVDFSIQEGSKKYWKDVGKSTVFKGHLLTQCFSRVHLDIVDVWNFRDPEKLLSGKKFQVEMLALIKPLLPQESKPGPSADIGREVGAVTGLASFFGALYPPLAIALVAAGLAVIAVKFLYGKYQELTETAQCLEAYIVDLTLILFDLFNASLKLDRQGRLNSKLISDTVEDYKEKRSERVHQLIRERQAFATQKSLGDLIRDQLPPSTE